MPVYTLQGPDGKTYQIEGPEGATAEQLGQFVASQQQPQQPSETPNAPVSALAGLGAGVGRTALGAQRLLGRGLQSIGATSAGDWLVQDAESGREKLSAELAPYKEANPISAGVGQFAGEVAATLPVGAGLAAPVAGAGRVLTSAAPKVAQGASALANALRTGGMAGGNLATRIAGGAVTGATAATLVNPEDTGMGALVGGALPVVAPIARGVASLGRQALGATTGVGDEAISQAFRAGQRGGQSGESFLKALRGQSNMDDVLTAARQNLQAMGQQKQAAYRSGMANIKADKAILGMDDISKSVDDAIGMATYKGQIKNEKAAEALGQIKGEIDNWRSLDPAEFHTPEGLDALKQKVGAILESIPYDQKTARSAAGGVYNSIKNEISKQAPEYSRVMREYSEATDAIKEIERALSLGQKASADTSMRKLQSLMRNNVNTSYGYRDALAQQLADAGGQEILPALAGQAMTEWMPRGIQRAATGAGGAGLALTGNIPAAAGLAAVSSPRLVGELAYGAGRAAGAIPQNQALANALRQGIYRAAPVAAAQ